MFATPRFVFLHLHKSGGTFVNECLERFVPDAKEIKYHYPRKLVPAEYAHLPVLGLVRNPWAYYVSWYSFQLQQERTPPLFRILSDNRALGFEPTIRNMLNLGSKNEHLDPLLAELPNEYGDHGLNVPRDAMEPIRNSGRGLYAHLYHHIYDDNQGNSAGVRMGRMETLREDILAMFAEVKQPISEEMRAHILKEPPANTSKHDAYTTYYSPELRDLVAERDAEIISKHDYRFG